MNDYKEMLYTLVGHGLQADGYYTRDNTLIVYRFGGRYSPQAIHSMREACEYLQKHNLLLKSRLFIRLRKS